MDLNKKQVTAVLGPTNTGKTYMAIETMLGFESGILGFPLRLLAREVYEKVLKRVNPSKVALITGEEKIIPANAKYFLCTTESMPIDKSVEFIGVDEIQMCADYERGHIFTDRLLNLRAEKVTMFLGSHTMRNIIESLEEDVEFISKERFSKLTYNGQKKISRLNRKTAIIAFSVEEVYAIAELVRRQKGGSAIVMGSLSPKTRNSQVELYQSGDVDYLVATDAIGMGINMDINNVYFTDLKKFDGKKLRRLNLSEISQIAGRAGRHVNDGNFGITGQCKNLTSEEIELIENHKLESLQKVCWRNSNLDFNNFETLINSLEKIGPGSNFNGIPKPSNANKISLNRIAISKSNSLIIDVVVIGELKNRKYKERGKCTNGDFLYVSGNIGDASLGLKILSKRQKRIQTMEQRRLVKKYKHPNPKIKLGKFLGQLNYVSSMIDITDGLLIDLHRLIGSKRKKLGARIVWEDIPKSKEHMAIQNVKDVEENVLRGGDDYELMFTIKRDFCSKFESLARTKKFKIFKIGKIIKDNKIILEIGGKDKILKPDGFTHRF